MNKNQALRLERGTKLRWKGNGREVTVKMVLRYPTSEYPYGRFPLVITEEIGAITYLALRFPALKT